MYRFKFKPLCNHRYILFVNFDFKFKNTFLYPSLCLISQKVHYFFHKIILMRIFLVFYAHVKSISKYLYYIYPISCWHKIKRNSQLLNKLIFSLGCSLINIYFISNYHARYMRTMMSHFLIPVLQILICYTTVSIKNKDCCMSTEIIGRMKLIEWFLTCCIPNIYIYLLVYPIHVAFKWKKIHYTILFPRARCL